ncbi:MAG: helix-turn-helix domain-containing protein [Clostridiales bacterium]|nr:helix-turn-helix domain-containing protein [Clostridiales bacterium]
MPEIKLGSTLKRYRQGIGWSVEEVSNELRENYGLDIATKTIYGWESDQAYPRTPVFIALCNLYGIEKLDTAVDSLPEPGGFRMSDDEKTIVLSLRRKPQMQAAVRKLLDVR